MQRPSFRAFASCWPDFIDARPSQGPCKNLTYSCSVAANLADVAKQAGVSEATVSRVLNGRSGISAATRATVLTALDVMGYERPTHLRVRHGRMVGLVVPELQNPIFPALAEVVCEGLARSGFNAVLCTRTGTMSEAEYVDMLLERQVSGMVFAGGQYAEADAPHEHYDRLLKLRLPVVLVNAAAEHLDFPRVSTDDAVAMQQAYGHLTGLGHERIGLILGPPDHVPSRRKLAAFEAAGRATAELVERTMFSLEGGHAAAARLIERGATGIVCASDPLALGAIRAARRAGLSVPADLSVIGFDDSAFMHCTDPPLTTVRQPIEAIGRAVVAMLTSQIEGSAVSAEELFFEPEIVARGSTAPPPSRA
jgi:DNA-binding LacI/PurR family transcriptional regulator